MTDYDLPFFDDLHRSLARDAAEWARSLGPVDHHDVDATCRHLVRELGAAGWLRYCVPADFGGARKAVDSRALCVLRETFAGHDSLLDFAFAMQGLGSGAIMLEGTPEQKAHYLPRVATGKSIAAFALSEPDAGSDVAAMTTIAQRSADGWTLDGSKTWISNGGIADFYCVFAKTDKEAGTRGISAFVVDAPTPGLAIAKRIELLAPHPLAEIEFNACEVKPAALLGALGLGFKLAMRTLDIFRSSVAAAAVGFARSALAAALDHACSRRLFGGTLSDLAVTQSRLGEMATAIDSAALLTYRAAWLRDVRGRSTTREAAMAKLHATESAQEVIDAALQLFGARGLVAGHIAERLYRDVRALRIYEGASEVQRIIIGRDVLRESCEKR